MFHVVASSVKIKKTQRELPVMKIYISAVNDGFEHFREAAVKAITSLQHDVINGDEGPGYSSVAEPSQIHDADAVVFLLGSRYGSRKPSGMSVIHEEYRHTRDRRPLFIFVKSDADMEEAQEAFKREVQSSAFGHYMDSFIHPDQLRSQITGALHAWELQQMRGKADSAEMLHRAESLLPLDKQIVNAVPALAISIAGGPLQTIVRPAELEREALKTDLLQTAMFGAAPIFTSAERTRIDFARNTLQLVQETRSFTLTGEGSMLFELPFERQPHAFPVVAEEDAETILAQALHFASTVLQKIDPVERLSNVAVAIKLLNAEHVVWGSSAEQNISLNTASALFNREQRALSLSPPHFNRATLRTSYEALARELTALLHQCFKRLDG
jgi:hypothetical protein